MVGRKVGKQEKYLGTGLTYQVGMINDRVKAARFNQYVYRKVGES